MFDNENADIADNSYYMYMEDIQLIKNMGIKYYRFSISWSRILPHGNGLINQAGIDHYNNIINNLLDNDIQPVVTIYHWDLPQALEDQYEGWLNKQIIKDFEYYADICFSSFGDRVKWWITINEVSQTD